MRIKSVKTENYYCNCKNGVIKKHKVNVVIDLRLV